MCPVIANVVSERMGNRQTNLSKYDSVHSNKEDVRSFMIRMGR